jgi:hypothetical protein
LQGGGSGWHALLQTLPRATLSPILWTDEEREQLLRGSPVQEVRACGITQRELRYFLEKVSALCWHMSLQEARTRQQALRQEWTDVVAFAHQSSSGSAAFPVDAFNEQAFLEV